MEGSCPFQKITQDTFDEFNIPLKVRDPVIFYGVRFDGKRENGRGEFEEDRQYLLYSLQAICQDAS